jgi:hypothetical protein
MKILPSTDQFADGAPIVQHLDAIGTKMLFEDAGFQEIDVPKRKGALLNKVSKFLHNVFSDAVGFGDLNVTKP